MPSSRSSVRPSVRFSLRDRPHGQLSNSGPCLSHPSLSSSSRCFPPLPAAPAPAPAPASTHPSRPASCKTAPPSSFSSPDESSGFLASRTKNYTVKQAYILYLLRNALIAAVIYYMTTFIYYTIYPTTALYPLILPLLLLLYYRYHLGTLPSFKVYIATVRYDTVRQPQSQSVAPFLSFNNDPVLFAGANPAYNGSRTNPSCHPTLSCCARAHSCEI